eukprot:4888784-Pyramimonas_sp.AAC.1
MSDQSYAGNVGIYFGRPVGVLRPAHRYKNPLTSIRIHIWPPVLGCRAYPCCYWHRRTRKTK